MEDSEKETIIVVNESDRQEGFFRFGTSNISDFKKLQRLLRQESAIIVKRSLTPKGKVSYWDVKVPIKYLGRLSLS